MLREVRPAQVSPLVTEGCSSPTPVVTYKKKKKATERSLCTLCSHPVTGSMQGRSDVLRNSEAAWPGSPEPVRSVASFLKAVKRAL